MLWILLALGIAADHVTTAHGLRRYGIKLEGNPIIRAVWRKWGRAGMLAVQVAVLFPALAVAQAYAPGTAFLIPLMVFAAAANNVRVISVMARRRRRKVEASRLQAETRSDTDAPSIGE